MPVAIKNRWTEEPIATVEDTDDLREAVIRLTKQGVSLQEANLYGANLTRANLTRANLTLANLTLANLTRANLDGANLTRANLTLANLYGANLDGANLDGANLTRANLAPIENDLYAVFAWAPAEVPALISALEQGHVNGSCYTDGKCGCLIGTLAIAAGADPYDPSACRVVHGLNGNGSRPIEMLFASIKTGDTPETNPVAKIVHGWSTGWLERMRAAFGEVATV